MTSDTATRRVFLLETDERAGLVAALAAACAARGVSLDMTTGPGHVLITFDGTPAQVDSLVGDLARVGGVISVHPYEVRTR